MVSPLCEVKNGAAAYVATANGVDVTPGNTVIIRLVDSSASTWSISCVYTDDLSVAATVNSGLTIDPVARTATFTAPVAGRAYIFKSTVNGGISPDGRARSDYSTTFGVYTLTAGGQRVVAANETTEGDAAFGWTKPINDLIRNGGGGSVNLESRFSVFNVLDYGADPTGVADSAAAINAAITASQPLGSLSPGGPFAGMNNRGAVVLIPQGKYRLSSSVIVDRAIILEGVGTPGWFSGTRLVADDGVTAVIVSNGPADLVTPPGPGGGPGDGSGAWSIVRQLAILGPGGGLGFPPGGSIPDCHGLDIWAACTFEHLYISGFTGNGVNLVASSGVRGNANTVRGTDSFLEYCTNGFYCEGADVNASTFVALSATNNKEWQIWDSSFLGNTHIGHHVRADGLSGQKSYKSDGAVNASIWIGCYSEEGGGRSEFDRPAVVLGGLHGTPNVGTASAPPNTYYEHQAFTAPDWAPAWSASTAVFRRFTRMRPPDSTFPSVPVWYVCETAGTTGATPPAFGTAATPGSLLTDGTAVWRCMGSALTAGAIGASGGGADALSFSSADVNAPWRMTYSDQRWKLRWAASELANALTLTGPNQYPGPATPQMPTGLILGQAYSWGDPGRKVVFDSAAPSAGFWRRGDTVFNSSPSSGGPSGWTCISGGMASAPTRANSTYYTAGSVVRPAVANGFVYLCVQALGTNSVSGSTPPTFPTTLDATVEDGDLTWVCAGVDTGPTWMNMGGDTLVLSGNFTTTNDTATSTALSIPVKNGERWAIEFHGTVQCSSTGGSRFAIAAPAGSTTEAWLDSSTTTTTTLSRQRITAAGTLTTATHTVATTPAQDHIIGAVTAGADGDITIQAASQTAGQTTTIFAGAYLVARRLTGV